MEDLGVFELTSENEECVLIIDEAGICFNNRDWKGLPKNVLEFLKYHRHYRCDVYFFSQAADMDKSIRDLSQTWYKVIKLPLLLNKFSALIPIDVQLVVAGGHWDLNYVPDNNIFAWKYIPIYKTWKYYNSFSRHNLDIKKYEKWDVLINDNNASFFERLFKKITNIFISIFYKLKNFINKILFRKKLRKKIIQNLDDGEYYEDFLYK